MDEAVQALPALGATLPVTSSAVNASTASSGESDVHHAVRNATKLGLSLLATWGIALVVRVYMPRHLGPALFGVFQFADAFTGGLFILGSLGIETYVRKEIATRREHASEFFGGLAVLQLFITVLLAIGSVIVLGRAGKPPEVLRLIAVMSASYWFFLQNATHAALLHAVGEVTELSLFSIVTKLVWGIGIVIALAFGGSVMSVGVAMLISEMVKMVVLHRLSKRHLDLQVRFDARATYAVVIGGLPFFVGSLSQTLYSKINISVLSFLASDTEVGWYGAASSVANMAMLLSPLLAWVLIPLLARAEARSDDGLAQLTQRTMSMVLAVAIPITLVLALGADIIVHILFGAAFEPSTLSLRVMAPVFVFTYIAIVASSTLIGQGRGWVATSVLSIGIVLSPVLNWLLIPRGLALFGPGGAGVGAAAALNMTEAAIAFSMTLLLRNPVLDRSGRIMLLKTFIICALVIAMDRLVLQAFGIPRVVADVVVYVLLVVVWKAADYQALLSLMRRARPTKSQTDVLHG